MIVKKNGGMTEFIPSPQEKREGLVRDYVFELLLNLHLRLERIEKQGELDRREGNDFLLLFKQIGKAESQNLELHREIILKSD